MFTSFKIGAGILFAITATLGIAACGSSGGSGTSSSGPLTSTSTCANWTADVSAGDTTDINNFVSADASTDQVSNATLINFISGHCGSNPNDNLTAVLSAAAISALAPPIPTN